MEGNAHLNLDIFNSLSILRPSINALHSALLLEALKLRFNAW